MQSNTKVQRGIVVVALLFVSIFVFWPVKSQPFSRYSSNHCFGHIRPWDPYYQRKCRLKNVCMPSVNEVVYYQTSDNPEMLPFDQPGPFIGISGRKEMRSVINATLIHGKAPSDALWISQTTILMQLHAGGNAGHTILETGLPLVTLAASFDENIADLQILLRDNCDNPLDQMTVAVDGPPECRRNVDTFLKPLSKKPIQYLPHLLEANQMVCFKDLLLGTSSSGLFASSGSERPFMYRMYRNRLWQSHGIQTPPKNKIFKVWIHPKKGRRSLSNWDMVYDCVKRYCELLNACTVDMTPLESFSGVDLIKKTVETDVYITPGGSAVFNSILMKEDSTVITFPLWDDPNEKKKQVTFLTFEFDIIAFIPHVKYYIYPLDTTEIDWNVTGFNKPAIASCPKMTSLMAAAIDYLQS